MINLAHCWVCRSLRFKGVRYQSILHQNWWSQVIQRFITYSSIGETMKKGEEETARVFSYIWADIARGESLVLVRLCICVYINICMTGVCWDFWLMPGGFLWAACSSVIVCVRGRESKGMVDCLCISCDLLGISGAGMRHLMVSAPAGVNGLIKLHSAGSYLLYLTLFLPRASDSSMVDIANAGEHYL